MTTLALPAGFCPNGFLLRLSTVERSYASPFAGSEQVVDLLNDRWNASMTLPNKRHADAARNEAFIDALRGMTNTVNLYHFARPVPLGTLRGAPTVVYATGKGATYLIVSGTPGQTLLAGDMVGIGGLLLRVALDTGVDGTGIMGVTLANRLRKDIPAGTAVVWDKPTAPFRKVSQSSVRYVPGYAEGASIDFVEAVSL